METQFEGSSVRVNVRTLNAGAEAQMTIYGQIYQLIESARSEPNDREIFIALANLNAIRNPLFPDQKSFDTTVRTLTERYKSPLRESVGIIKSTLITAIEETSKNYLDAYPRLHAEVVYLINDNLNKCEEKTWHHLNSHVEAQKAFMNTRHPDFLESAQRIEPNLPPLVPSQATPNNGSLPESMSSRVKTLCQGVLTLKTIDEVKKFVVLTTKNLTLYNWDEDTDGKIYTMIYFHDMTFIIFRNRRVL